MKIIKATVAVFLFCAVLLSASCRSFSDKGIEPVAKEILDALGSEYVNGESAVELPNVSMTYAAFIRENADQVPDRVSIYRADDKDGADKVERACLDYLAVIQDGDNIKFVGSYDLKSAEKLKSAEVVRIENYILICVSDAKTVGLVKATFEKALYE